jgi:GR25 family glycosyltransferase involved in LPS biosynthesis
MNDINENIVKIDESDIKEIGDIKHIFYINLATRPDRKIYVENQIKQVGLKAKRFNAIRHKYGAVGCSLSHLSLLKYAKNNNLEHILIMEDDITFLDPLQFIHNINKCLSKQKDYDVLLIAGNNMGDYEILDEYCAKVKFCQTTTGYLVKKHYYDTIIKNYEESIKNLMKYISTKNVKLINYFSIDCYWFHLQNKDNWFLVTPLTITQKTDYSNIEKKYVNYNKVMLILDKKKCSL